MCEVLGTVPTSLGVLTSVILQLPEDGDCLSLPLLPLPLPMLGPEQGLSK